MFSAKSTALSEKTHKILLYANDTQLTYQQTINYWKTSPAFCAFWIQQLQASPFTGYTWETPSITTKTVDRPFECVTVYNALFQGLSPEIQAFEDCFSKENPVVDFPNLSGDAHLVVPCPLAKESCYTHIACFTQNAPMSQQLALWQKVGATAAVRLSEKPMWISTAGMGIYWLHVRFDSRPKYYRHREYC